MAPAALLPAEIPTTPTTETTSKLTKAGIIHSEEPSPLGKLNASKTKLTVNPSPRPVPAPNSPDVWAQRVCTDHMLTVAWNSTTGWQQPHLQPYGPLTLMPTASVLHYATECFEGMKAYRGVDGRVRLFRPDRNCARLLRSATRIALPAFEPEELLKLIKQFVARDAPKWLPREQGPGFLYLRPTMIATAPAIGVQKPFEALLYIIAVLFPPLDDPSATPALPPSLSGAANGVHVANGESKQIELKNKKLGMKLLASEHDTIRAWPGGFGYAKVGANYGPSLVAQGEARLRGYDQILWLFGDECRVTEAGASNFFVLWKNKQTGKRELVTAPLGSGVILEGVTRASVLEAVRRGMCEGLKEGSIDVVERDFNMAELVEAAKEERLLEAFGSGTAFFVAPVQEIHFRGVDLRLPLEASEVEGEIGGCEVAMAVKRFLKAVMYGKVHHEWGVLVEEDKGE
ncbi:MAG: hypothetical protein Q9227_008596 [Pyrenula ochraceoflavens]